MPSALDTAVKLLAGRPKSRARLEQALLSRGHPPDEVHAALERVAQLGYLDDRRYAETKARSALADGRAPRAAVLKLQAEGVESAVAEAAVEAAAKEAAYDPLSAAKALVRRRRLSGAKAARFLSARGFSEDVVRAAVPGLEDQGA
jgi:regulatory protein